MNKKISLLSLALVANISLAQIPTIKLSCDVIIKKHTNGTLSKVNPKTILLDIAQDEKSLYILSTDDDMRSVLTEKAPHVAEVINYSSENRWHLINKSNDDVPFVTKMLIDRNSGQLLYTQESNGAVKLFTEVTGTCSKVDMQKKKF